MTPTETSDCNRDVKASFAPAHGSASVVAAAIRDHDGMKTKIIYVTQEQYDAVEKEPVDASGKIKPDRLAKLIGRDKMLQIMHASVHSLPVDLRARKLPNAEVSDGGLLTHELPAAHTRRSLH